jgi:hypothetical protein
VSTWPAQQKCKDVRTLETYAGAELEILETERAFCLLTVLASLFGCAPASLRRPLWRTAFRGTLWARRSASTCSVFDNAYEPVVETFSFRGRRERSRTVELGPESNVQLAREGPLWLFTTPVAYGKIVIDGTVHGCLQRLDGVAFEVDLITEIDHMTGEDTEFRVELDHASISFVLDHRLSRLSGGAPGWPSSSRYF